MVRFALSVPSRFLNGVESEISCFISALFSEREYVFDEVVVHHNHQLL
jgi:hypothetical protein